VAVPRGTGFGWLVACLVTLSCGVGATTGPVTAPPDPAALPVGARYVAIGSSFASGPGLAPMSDPACGRAQAGYPALVAVELDLALENVSCAATTTDNVLTKPHDTGTDTRAPQGAAVTVGTRLVTMTIGGNDVGYATLLDDLACVDNGTCPGARPDRAGVESALDTVVDRLVATVDTVRERAPRARVLLVTYPRIVPPSGTCPEIVLTEQSAEFAGDVGRRLDEAFTVAARRSGAVLVDVYAASAGHDACAADPWVGGWLPYDNPGGVRAFHPTEAGMRAVADLVVRAIRS
jgi:lysophospholipase L1-like esterase